MCKGNQYLVVQRKQNNLLMQVNPGAGPVYFIDIAGGGLTVSTSRVENSTSRVGPV